MEVLEMLAQRAEMFSELPTIIKAITVLGFIMPLAVLHTFLNPQPGKKEKPKKTVSLKGGGKIEIYEVEIDGEKRRYSRLKN